MMIIKFRGKEIENGNWVYGYYYATDNKHFILSIDDYAQYEIDPKTVGQFVNLQDKNRVDIYVGDIVAGKNGVDNFGNKWNWPRRQVTFHIAYGALDPSFSTKSEKGDNFYTLCGEEEEVIGNVYDV